MVVGVLVAVALGVRSMRAEGGEDDWDSPVGDSEFADPEDLGHSIRRGGERGRGGSAGARRPAVAGSATATDPGFDPGFRQVTPDEVPAPRAPVGPAPSVAPVASARPGRRHSQQKDQPKKRHSQRKDQPKRPARPPRLRGGDAGKDWNTTNWERVSDEDYWAEMSADKPLASRTAQSAADLRPGEPEASKERDTRTDPKLSQPERQTAAMAMPGVASSRRYEAAARGERASGPQRRRLCGCGCVWRVLLGASRCASQLLHAIWVFGGAGRLSRVRGCWLSGRRQLPSARRRIPDTVARHEPARHEPARHEPAAR